MLGFEGLASWRFPANRPAFFLGFRLLGFSAWVSIQPTSQTFSWGSVWTAQFSKGLWLGFPYQKWCNPSEQRAHPLFAPPLSCPFSGPKFPGFSGDFGRLRAKDRSLLYCPRPSDEGFCSAVFASPKSVHLFRRYPSFEPPNKLNTTHMKIPWFIWAQTRLGVQLGREN